MVLNGYFIPEGNLVGMASYTLHRDPSIWGEDWAEYRPERVREEVILDGLVS